MFYHNRCLNNDHVCPGISCFGFGRLHETKTHLAHRAQTCVRPRPDCLQLEIQHHVPRSVPTSQRVRGPPGWNLGPWRFQDSSGDLGLRLRGYAQRLFFSFATLSDFGKSISASVRSLCDFELIRVKGKNLFALPFRPQIKQPCCGAWRLGSVC